MKDWVIERLNWIVRGNDLSSNSKHPIFIFGRVILSLWIMTILFFALVMAGMFVTHPGDFFKTEPTNECITVDTQDGSAVNTCDYLTP